METREEAPRVSTCNAEQCAYNRDNVCHAHAINIGNGESPLCDTFFLYDSHVGGSQIGEVATCNVAACKHNAGFKCAAEAISVRLAAVNAASCMTFARR